MSTRGRPIHVPFDAAMAAIEFRDWQELHGLKGSEVAKLFGISKTTVTRYRDHGAPLSVYWACHGYTAVKVRELEMRSLKLKATMPKAQ